MKSTITRKKTANRFALIFCLGILFLADAAMAQKATWIWYPGDYEVWLSNKMQSRRAERGSFKPPFWKLDSPYPLIEFHKDFTLPAAEKVDLNVEGQYNVKLDGTFQNTVNKNTTANGGAIKLSTDWNTSNKLSPLMLSMARAMPMANRHPASTVIRPTRIRSLLVAFGLIFSA